MDSCPAWRTHDAPLYQEAAHLYYFSYRGAPSLCDQREQSVLIITPTSGEGRRASSMVHPSILHTQHTPCRHVTVSLSPHHWYTDLVQGPEHVPMLPCVSAGSACILMEDICPHYLPLGSMLLFTPWRHREQ